MMMLSASMWQYKGHKLVLMACINFEDHALIKRWRANEKMNVIGRMCKDEKKM
jgi:acyl CoA:acetate/3-ketoacid CoA transferase alpha subunit